MNFKYFVFFGVFAISTSLFSQNKRVENLPTFDKKKNTLWVLFGVKSK